MSTQLENLPSHFNAYYQHNSLVVQFAISEFVEAYQLYKQIQYQAKSPLSLASLESTLPELYACFIQLIGYSSYPHAFALFEQGSLSKLKDYCEQFSQNSYPQNKIGLVLYNQVYKLWLKSLYILESLRKLELAIESKEELLLALEKELNQFNLLMKRMTKQIPRILAVYQNDENVLYFLLRNQNQLTNIYGSSFILKIFKTLFKKERQAFQWLTKRYTERGFNHLMPTLHQQFDQICVPSYE